MRGRLRRTPAQSTPTVLRGSAMRGIRARRGNLRPQTRIYDRGALTLYRKCRPTGWPTRSFTTLGPFELCPTRRHAQATTSPGLGTASPVPWNWLQCPVPELLGGLQSPVPSQSNHSAGTAVPSPGRRPGLQSTVPAQSRPVGRDPVPSRAGQGPRARPRRRSRGPDEPSSHHGGCRGDTDLQTATIING